MCAHGGQVMLIPSQTIVTIRGQPGAARGRSARGADRRLPAAADPRHEAVHDGDLDAARLGLAARHGGRGSRSLLATLSGITDGVPPGTIMVASPGQTTVEAN